jgi:biotin transporter BioY
LECLLRQGAFIVISQPPVPITAQTFFLNIEAVLFGGIKADFP